MDKKCCKLREDVYNRRRGQVHWARWSRWHGWQYGGGQGYHWGQWYHCCVLWQQSPPRVNRSINGCSNVPFRPPSIWEPSISLEKSLNHLRICRFEFFKWSMMELIKRGKSSKRVISGKILMIFSMRIIRVFVCIENKQDVTRYRDDRENNNGRWELGNNKGPV